LLGDESITDQVTGPVTRFANSIAAQGYVVASPCVYHEFEGPKALAYDGPGTDAGNAYKKRKLSVPVPPIHAKLTPLRLTAIDDDAKATIDLLVSLPNCTGRIGATGMCLGGHLAFRCAFDPRILASVWCVGRSTDRDHHSGRAATSRPSPLRCPLATRPLTCAQHS
jgi:carboxymethylenebutenolidase